MFPANKYLVDITEHVKTVFIWNSERQSNLSHLYQGSMNLRGAWILFGLLHLANAAIKSSDYCPAGIPCKCTLDLEGVNSEADCSNKWWTSLPDEIINMYSTFKVFNFTLNHLHQLPDDCFQNTRNLRILDFTMNRFMDIPENALRNLRSLRTLILADNDIQNVSVSTPMTINRLSLSQNKIESLNNDSFNNFQSLTNLDLSQNHIREISSAVFKSLHNLRTLDISQNFLSTITPSSFEGLKNLVTLNLAGNCLNSVENGTFVHCSELKTLQLSNNELLSLDHGMFSWLHELEVLHLGRNSIETLPDGIFESLSSLKELYLWRNILESVHPRSFEGLEANLTLLRLDFNLISDFGAALQNLTNLDKLFLAGNPITRLPDLKHLSMLRTLDISHCLVEQILPCEMMGLSNLEVLWWGTSPIVCDCQMKGMNDWIKTKEHLTGQLYRLYYNEFDWVCQKPRFLKGRNFDELSDTDLTCPDGQTPLWCHLESLPPLTLSISLSHDDVILHWNSSARAELVHVRVKAHPGDKILDLKLAHVKWQTTLGAFVSKSGQLHEICVDFITNNTTVARNCTHFLNLNPPASHALVASGYVVLIAVLIGVAIVAVVLHRRFGIFWVPQGARRENTQFANPGVQDPQPDARMSHLESNNSDSVA